VIYAKWVQRYQNHKTRSYQKMVRRQIKKQDSEGGRDRCWTVSSTIQEFRQNDPEFDLLREACCKTQKSRH
jgi:hypothetical protein